MDSATTHLLDGMRKAQYVVRELWMHGFHNHLHPTWDETSTMCHKRTVNVDDHSRPRYVATSARRRETAMKLEAWI